NWTSYNQNTSLRKSVTIIFALRSGLVLRGAKRASRLPPTDSPYLILLVRMRGLEPPRCHHHRLLRPARLPVPPHPQDAGEVIMRMRVEGVKNACLPPTGDDASVHCGCDHDCDSDLCD